MTDTSDSGRNALATGVLEILIVFAVALMIVVVGWTLVGADPLARQAVVWIANLAMLTSIWIGLRRRGQTWEHLGLGLRFGGWKSVARTVLQSLVALVVALVAFVIGAMVMGVTGGGEQGADMSSYEYLQGNLPALLLALAAVYVVSSFGEEVVYRGFLMTRIAELGEGSRAAWAMALIVSSVVFGLVHFDWGIVGVVQTGFMGLALGGSYLVFRRNLWSLVLSHVYIDTLLLVQLYAGSS